MKTTATTPRKWRNVYLTHNKWDKLRPAIKSATINYSASGCFEGIYLEVYVNKTEAKWIADYSDFDGYTSEDAILSVAYSLLNNCVKHLPII